MTTLSAPPAAATSPAPVGVVTPARRSSFRGLFTRRSVAIVLTLLAFSAALSFRVVDVDSGYDALGLVRAVGHDAAHLRWQYAAIVVTLAGAHYVATAIAARAVAGTPLPFGETLLIQLAASAANRITPAGLGGSAVTARYFTKRGLPAASAIGAVIALDVCGAVADMLVLTLLILFGTWVGLSGGTAEFGRLSSKLTGALGPVHSVWTWSAVAFLVIVLVLLRGRISERVRRATANLWAPVRLLLHRPGSLLAVLGASGATTVLLALAFAASAAMVPGPHPTVSLGTLVIGFMLGSAASNAVPTPIGIGATETALVSVLVISGIPIAHAVEVVVIFRIVTFWIPPIAGVLVGRHLRRNGAL